MTREHGMTFRPDMAAALRNGTKTQHRVLIEPQPVWMPAEGLRSHGWCWRLDEKSPPKLGRWNEPEFSAQLAKYAPWRAGDRIFAKEDHKLFCHKGENGTVKVQYRDGEVREVDCYPVFEFHGIGSHLPWTEARHMPKWAARTWLEVVKDPFPQRIRDISEADAQAEGANAVGFRSETEGIAGYECRIDFNSIWESLYPGSWERNDWVWALSFKVLKAKGRAE